MSPLEIYALIGCPVYIIIGCSAATIGFTAWLLVVPLLLVGFKLHVQQAIVVAASVDCLNALVILLLFAFQAWRSGSMPTFGVAFARYGRVFLFAACIGLACCITCLFFSERVLTLIQDRLKGGIGFVLIIIGCLFIVRGVIAYRRGRKLASSVPPASMTIQTTEAIPVQQEESLPLLGSEQQQQRKSAHGDEEEQQVLTLGQVFWHCEPGIWSHLRGIVAILVCVISGSLSGLLGVGSGLNFTLVFLVVFRTQIRQSTLLACGMMFLLTAAILISIPLGSLTHIDMGNLYPWLLMSLGYSMCGVFLGFFLSTRVSPVALNFLVAACLIVGGILATVEIILFN